MSQANKYFMGNLGDVNWFQEDLKAGGYAKLAFSRYPVASPHCSDYAFLVMLRLAPGVVGVVGGNTPTPVQEYTFDLTPIQESDRAGEWWNASLSDVLAHSGYKEQDFWKDIGSRYILSRAQAYLALASYHGPGEFDQAPETFKLTDIHRRYGRWA